MTSEQFEKYIEEMKEHVASTIRTTVNGKMDRMQNQMDVFMADDKAWKKKADPVIELGTNVRSFGKVVFYILGFIAACGAAWSALAHFGLKIIKFP